MNGARAFGVFGLVAAALSLALVFYVAIGVDAERATVRQAPITLEVEEPETPSLPEVIPNPLDAEPTAAEHLWSLEERMRSLERRVFELERR